MNEEQFAQFYRCVRILTVCGVLLALAGISYAFFPQNGHSQVENDVNWLKKWVQTANGLDENAQPRGK